MRRGFLRGSCGLALLASLAAASVATTPAAGRTVQLTPINIGMLPLEPTAQAMYAKHRGGFRKQGIDAKLTILADPAQIVAALLSGDVQFIATHVGAAAALKSKGAPVKVVAGGATYDPKAPNSALVAAKGKRITRARDLVGKTIALDAPNTIAQIGVLEWLEKSGIDVDDVKFTIIPFGQMLGPLAQGTIDAALVAEPYRTMALQRGAKHIAYPFAAVCSKNCLLTFWVARSDVDQNVAARFRNAIQAAAVWANQKKNDEASGKILAKYVLIDAAVLKKMTRTTFATRLRPALAQPWLDAFAKRGSIPAGFKASELVK
jgi:NitT/TauT family transport system substrate-binding protein